MSKPRVNFNQFRGAAPAQKLLNLFNDEDIDEEYIIDNLDYLNNIESTIEELRSYYRNDNSLKSYQNILNVIGSHLLSLKGNYQTLTRLNINVDRFTIYQMKCK